MESNLTKIIRPFLVATICCSLDAAEAGETLVGDADKFYVFITSDPQFPYISTGDPRLADYGNDARKLSKALIKEQYDTISYIARDLKRGDPSTPIRGIIINGDLTNYGHGWQLDTMKGYWNNSLPGTHFFMGLGNHDYENNINDCDGNHWRQPHVRFHEGPSNEPWNDHRIIRRPFNLDFSQLLVES